MEIAESAGRAQRIDTRPELDALLLLIEATEHAMTVSVDADLQSRVLALPQIRRR